MNKKVKFLEESGLLLKVISKTIKSEWNQKSVFLSKVLGLMVAILLRSFF